MSRTDKVTYSVVAALTAAFVWFSMVSPVARECTARGGNYYALSGDCGVFRFEPR
jgi:hypothetical protein